MDTDLERTRAQLPRFATFNPADVQPAVDALLARNRAALAALGALDGAPGWDNFVEPLDDLNDALSRCWSPVRHLHGVLDSEALREAYNAALPAISAYGTELLQNDGLYRGFAALEAAPDFAMLSPARRQVVLQSLRDFRLGGIALDPARRVRFSEVQQELAKLGARFEENVLDATRAFEYHTTDAAELAGLPDPILGLTAQNAQQAGRDGWLLTLDLPCYQAVLMYADDRTLRHTLYDAYVTRASELSAEGRFDNSEVISRILALRQESARLLDFADYAALSLATKMAGSPAEVLGFLRDLARRSRPVALRELGELEAFAARELGMAQLEAWDVPYASEKLRQHSYAISQETLRPYFPVARVLSGLFEIIRRLFGVRIAKLDGIDVWHPDVACYEVRGEADGDLRGVFYLDIFARAHKRGGAWMDDCLGRRRVGGEVRHPAAYLTCNFTPPVEGRPSLLTHDEVITLFHEFGHGLHHLLTRIDEPGVAGINGVAWDAVELPSQFMENWCWEREALDLLSAHHETGEPLSDDLLSRLRAAKNFQAGLKSLRQIEFALFDFRLHAEFARGLDVQTLLDEVRNEVAVLIPPRHNRFQHSFSHIFAGGYAAGYYSYKWAEVLAADAFSRFEEAGVFDPQAGADFLHAILERGGSEDAAVLFRRFRGRDPSIEALIRRSGLTA
ncbi:MAG: M3 family metallopeptidase [Gammaproteobacteria bacterium]|nr:M3 family metallopeptidase [Gammaproteobacteria bacterium]